MYLLRPIAIAVLSAATSAYSAPNLVTNGSLTAAIENNGVPTGWSILAGTPDVLDAHNNVGQTGDEHFGAVPTASPDGGTWVGLGSDIGYIEQFGQVLSGLTPGNRYTVSWVDGNFGYSFGKVSYLGQNAIEVLVDGASLGSGTTLALGSNWYNESLTFVATAAQQQISFKLAGAEKAYVSIDGVAVQAIPEPGTMGLLGLGLAGLALAVRRRS
jgi:hypothetical protein